MCEASSGIITEEEDNMHGCGKKKVNQEQATSRIIRKGKEVEE